MYQKKPRGSCHSVHWSETSWGWWVEKGEIIFQKQQIDYRIYKGIDFPSCLCKTENNTNILTVALRNMKEYLFHTGGWISKIFFEHIFYQQ